jgi:hypothetical protein
MAKCNLGDGKSALSWTDIWRDNCLQYQLAHLVTFAKSHTMKVQEVIHTEFLEDLFHLPMSQEAFVEFQHLENICHSASIKTQSGNKDEWTYIWGNNKFSTKNAYKAMIGSIIVPPHFNWLWKSSCQAKHKFFLWLLIHDRLNTRNLLRRKKIQLPSYLCVTAQCQQDETLVHLFWSCCFTSQCWDFISPQRVKDVSIPKAIPDMKNKLRLAFTMDIILLATWGIWMVIYNEIFNNQTPSFDTWKFLYL